MTAPTTYDHFRSRLEGRTFPNLSAAQKATGTTRSSFFRMIEIFTQDNGVRMTVGPDGVQVLFDALPAGELSTTQLAQATGLSVRRIRQLAPALVEQCLARQGPIRSAWLYRPEAIDAVKQQMLKPE